MNNFDNGYDSMPKRDQDFDYAGDTIYYDGRKMKKLGTGGKVFLAIWAIATVVLLAYVIIGNKGDNFVSALIWQAIFVISFYLLRYSNIVIIKPFCIAGIFFGFSAIPTHLFNLEEYADAELTNTLLQSIIPSGLLLLFLAMFSIGYTKQQYDREASRCCNVEVAAKVSGIKRSYVTLGKLDVPVLSYSFNGRKYETVYNRPLDFSKNRYMIGQTATIKIDPTNPSNIHVTPQAFNQITIQSQNEDTATMVNEFKQLYKSQRQYSQSEQTYTDNNQYRNGSVVTNTTYHNSRPPEKIHATFMSYVFILWFILSVVIGFVGAYKNPFITLLAFGQIPLVIGVILFFGIGEGTTHSPAAGACAFGVGLVLVLIAGINLFGAEEIKQLVGKIMPILMLSVFNIAGISLICVPLCSMIVNKKHHTEEVTGYVIGLRHKIVHRERRGMVDVYAPIYGYTYRGKKYITESTIYTQNDYPAEGSSRNILINPDNPMEIYEPQRSDTTTLLCVLFGVIMSGMSLFATFLFVISYMS